MTAGLRPYPDYKDSGLPWLGQVPVHWDVRASKRMFTESGERTWPDDQQLSATQAYGVILQAEYERLVNRKVVRILNHLDKRKHVEKDDFVISMRSFQGGLERAWCRGAIRSSYVVLKPREGIYVQYFAHLFKSHPYIQALRTTSEFIRDGQDLTFSNFCDVPLPVVPLDEQKAIADYLDANAVMIRRFILNRRRLLEVLNEQKQAIINRAVTRGLDPDVPHKPSGIEWLGDVPKHWEVRRLKTLGKVIMGQSPPSTECNADGNGRPFLQGSAEFGPSNPRAIQCCPTAPKTAPSGAILFSVRAPVGAMNVADQDYGIGRGLCAIIPDIEILDRNFAMHAITVSKVELLMIATGSTYDAVSVGEVGAMRLPLPPKDEQQAIASHIFKETATLSRAIERTQREIDLIREYRTRLIADVVTGKVDVRHLVPDTPAKTVSVAGRKPVDPGRAANIYFRRAVFAAEIVHRLHHEPTFGHTKFQKLFFLCERQCGVDTGSRYYRQAAGPYDNRALRSIDSQMEKQGWYAAHRDDKRYWYVPLAEAGGHKNYFERYFASVEDEFTKIIELFRKANTEQCEIVATLYSAWEDLLGRGEQITEDQIIEEVLHNWHPTKRRIEESRWRSAIDWMKKKDLVPRLMASPEAEDLECLAADECLDEMPEGHDDEIVEELTDDDD